jgi:hypothetical protein
VFYGDHLPGLYPAAIQELNGEQRMRETPFFVWKNFGPDPLERPTMTVSPSQLVPVLLETVDAPVSPYVALLDTVRAEVPAVQRGMFVRPDGSVVDREADLPDAARRALEDYRLVQYDLAVGQQWSAPGLVRSAPRPGGG